MDWEIIWTINTEILVDNSSLADKFWKEIYLSCSICAYGTLNTNTKCWAAVINKDTKLISLSNKELWGVVEWRL